MPIALWKFLCYVGYNTISIVEDFEPPTELVAGISFKKFVEALASGDYNKALSYLNVDVTKSFLVSSDIEFALPRSSFADVVNVNATDFTFTTEIDKLLSDSAICIVSVHDNHNADNTRMFSVSVVLNDENKWIVDSSDFYYTNYSFRTAGGNTTVIVNDKPLSGEFCTSTLAGTTGLAKDYTLPYVGKNEIEVTIISDNYMYTKMLATASDNEIGKDDEFFKAVSEEEDMECLNFIKDA